MFICVVLPESFKYSGLSSLSCAILRYYTPWKCGSKIIQAIHFFTLKKPRYISNFGPYPEFCELRKIGTFFHRIWSTLFKFVVRSIIVSPVLLFSVISLFFSFTHLTISTGFIKFNRITGPQHQLLPSVWPNPSIHWFNQFCTFPTNQFHTVHCFI